MTISIRRTDDVELVHRLHQKTFPADKWDGKKGTVHWLAWDGDKPIGFCSAKLLDSGVMFLNRVGVIESHRGGGLQRRMIGVRVNYGRQHGVTHVITYTVKDNFPSISNLIKCGFKFYYPECAWVGDNVFYFRKCIA